MKPPQHAAEAWQHLSEAIRHLEASTESGADELAAVIKTCRAGMNQRGQAGVVDAVLLIAKQMEQASPGLLKKLMGASG